MSFLWELSAHQWITVGYIEDGATRLIDELQEWEPTVGFLYSLLMCSKGTVSERIRTEKLDSEILLRTYEWLANQGDPVSQLGAVEVALRNIENHRGLEPFIERIVERFIADDRIIAVDVFTAFRNDRIGSVGTKPKAHTGGRSPLLPQAGGHCSGVANNSRDLWIAGGHSKCRRVVEDKWLRVHFLFARSDRPPRRTAVVAGFC